VGWSSPAVQHAANGVANGSARIAAVMTSHQELVVAGVAMANGRSDSRRERFLLECLPGGGTSYPTATPHGGVRGNGTCLDGWAPGE
jgi:hypothetical protein